MKNINMEDIKSKIQTTIQKCADMSSRKIKEQISDAVPLEDVIPNKNTSSESTKPNKELTTCERSRLDACIEEYDQVDDIDAQMPTHNTRHKKRNAVAFPRQSARDDVNADYNRTRRYDSSGKYRIGPTFITPMKLSYMDANKPGKLSVKPDHKSGNNLEFGLLTYLWTFTDQHDKTELDLTFVKSLVDSGKEKVHFIR